MSHEINIHDAQTSILRELLFHPAAGFAKLQKPTGLTSDHFNFHIARLVELGLVEKVTRGTYRLTPRGKEYANRLDTDNNTVERQPKVSVALLVERKGKIGEREFLCQQRLKNPYYGYWGRLGGKVRWGESIEEAAARELTEETGLQADFSFKMLYHKRDYKDGTDELLEDKIFLIMHTGKVRGKLLERFEGGYNKWMTQDELLAQKKRFESAYEFIELVDSGKTFYERKFYYTADEY